LEDLGVVCVDGYVQRSPSKQILLPNRSIKAKEELDEVLVVSFAGPVQWGESNVICLYQVLGAQPTQLEVDLLNV